MFGNGLIYLQQLVGWTQAFGAQQALRRWGGAARKLVRGKAHAARRGPPTAADEAAQVRALAEEHLRRDPGFAAELFAIAARHERLHGA